MTYMLKPGTSWQKTHERCVAVAPEAFHEDRILNLWGGEWRRDGTVSPAVTPVDGTPIAAPPRLSSDIAKLAVQAGMDQHRTWREVPLAEL